MSGGSYDYAYLKLEEFADALREVGGCGDNAATPAERIAFAEHCRKVASAMKACEWNESGDGASDEAELIRAVLTKGEVEKATAIQLQKLKRAAEDIIRAIAAQEQKP